MRERARKRQSLRLTAREPHTAAADDGIEPLLHHADLAVERGQGEKCHRVAVPTAEDVGAHAVVPQLGVMAEIADRRRDLARRERGQFAPAEGHGAAVGLLAEEDAPERRLAAGHRAGDADDLAGTGSKRQPLEDGLAAFVGEGEIFEHDVLRRRSIERRERLGRFHQRLDALPGDLRAVHGVEELCGLGGFGRELQKTGEKRRERGDIPRAPARAEYVFCAKPQDEEHAHIGQDEIKRRQRRLPDVCAHGGALVAIQRGLIARLLRFFAAVDAVGDGVFRAVERCGAERCGGLFTGCARALDDPFHRLGADV